MVLVPYIPPVSTSLSAPLFEAVIAKNGMRLAWQKSHDCPCVYATPVAGNLTTPGSPQPNCRTCFGTGVYWDSPSDPFTGLVTFMHMSPSPDEPGSEMTEKWGVLIKSEPTVTVPHADANGNVIPAWEQSSTWDQFIEIDATARYNAFLSVGQNETVPFIQNLSIAATGAVTYYDQTTAQVLSTDNYVVSGATVTVSGLPIGTAYTVEFYASPVYIAFRSAGGLPHVRPFGGPNTYLPRRFRAQTLDIWTRNRQAQAGIKPDTSAGALTAPIVSMVGRAGT